MTFLQNLFKTSNKAASLLPPLLADSSLLLKSIIVGLHSTRFAGKGENFWQFKEYTPEESITNIDWRKSASSKKILIRQNEEELAKTIYFFYDKSLSMNYQSDESVHNKLFYSALLTLTLCKLFSKNKEEIYIFNGLNKPINCSNNINNFDTNFLKNTKKHSYPDISSFKDQSLCIFFSDFLYDNNRLKEIILRFKNKRILGHLVQVLDPMEVDFKLNHNTLLQDMETNETMMLDYGDNFLNDYKKKLSDLQKDLKKICTNSGWKYSKFCTNQDAGKFLINLIKTISLNKQKTF